VSWLWRPGNYRLSQVQQSAGRNEGSLAEVVREMWAGTSPSTQTEPLRSDVIRRNRQSFLAEENACAPASGTTVIVTNSQRRNLFLHCILFSLQNESLRQANKGSLPCGPGGETVRGAFRTANPHGLAQPLAGCGKTLIRAGLGKGTTSQLAEKLGL